jgi:hypothetical protein
VAPDTCRTSAPGSHVHPGLGGSGEGRVRWSEQRTGATSWWESLLKFHQAVKEARADVVLGSYPFLSNLVEKLASMRNRKAGGPNPLRSVRPDAWPEGG